MTFLARDLLCNSPCTVVTEESRTLLNHCKSLLGETSHTGGVGLLLLIYPWNNLPQSVDYRVEIEKGLNLETC